MAELTPLQARREEIVREHMRVEMAHDIDGLIATFVSPEVASYDIVPLGRTHDGETEVREVIGQLLTGFPDLHLEIVKLHHSDDAVIVEGRTTGTHLGRYAGLEPTGKRMDVRGAIFFRFDGEGMTNETVYSDQATVMMQLGMLEPPSAAD